MERKILEALLSKLQHGGIKVRYWDDTSKQFGPEKPYITILFHSPKALRAVLTNLSLGFGEQYAAGAIDIQGSLNDVNRLVSENRQVFQRLPAIS